MGCEAGNRGEVSYFRMGCQQLTDDIKQTWQMKGPSCCFQPWQRNLLTFKDGLAHPSLPSHSNPAVNGLISLPVEGGCCHV